MTASSDRSELWRENRPMSPGRDGEQRMARSESEGHEHLLGTRQANVKRSILRGPRDRAAPSCRAGGALVGHPPRRGGTDAAVARGGPCATPGPISHAVYVMLEGAGDLARGQGSRRTFHVPGPLRACRKRHVRLEDGRQDQGLGGAPGPGAGRRRGWRARRGEATRASVTRMTAARAGARGFRPRLPHTRNGLSKKPSPFRHSYRRT